MLRAHHVRAGVADGDVMLHAFLHRLLHRGRLPLRVQRQQNHVACGRGRGATSEVGQGVGRERGHYERLGGLTSGRVTGGVNGWVGGQGEGLGEMTLPRRMISSLLSPSFSTCVSSEAHPLE
eukprot:3803388-Pyramimonas_sp.AAC.1